MRLSSASAIAVSAFTLGTCASADPGPTAVIVANLSNEDVYLSNVLFKDMGKTPEMVLTYNEDAHVKNRRPAQVLSPWLTFGKPATHLLRAGEAVYLEALEPVEGHVSEIAVIQKDGKKHAALRYTVIEHKGTLAGRIQGDGGKRADLAYENPAFLFFNGFVAEQEPTLPPA